MARKQANANGNIKILLICVVAALQLSIWNVCRNSKDISQAGLTIFNSITINIYNEPKPATKCQEININNTNINNKTLPNGYGGFGNFLEHYFHEMSCQCLLLLNDYTNITSLDEMIHSNGFNKYYYEFSKFVPQGIHYIDSVCKQYLCNIANQNLTEYYLKNTYDICFNGSNIRPARWSSLGLAAYHNTPFIDALSDPFNKAIGNYYQENNESTSKIPLNECDITIHLRMGDYLKGYKGCFPRVGFFGMSYYNDTINEILSKMPQCTTNTNKRIYIVTQLNNASMRHSDIDTLRDMTTQVIYTYKNELNKLFSHYNYKTQLISTSIINDWNILRNSKNLICVTSTFCHTAGLASVYGSNMNLVMPGVGLFEPFTKMPYKWDNTWPSNHIRYYSPENYLDSCKLYRLNWNNVTNIPEFIKWIQHEYKV